MIGQAIEHEIPNSSDYISWNNKYGKYNSKELAFLSQNKKRRYSFHEDGLPSKEMESLSVQDKSKLSMEKISSCPRDIWSGTVPRISKYR